MALTFIRLKIVIYDLPLQAKVSLRKYLDGESEYVRGKK